MSLRLGFTVLIILPAACWLISCGHTSGRMPERLAGMDQFLTEKSPAACRKYHYNFERQAPRLYGEQKIDSLLDVIEYISMECGPVAKLDVTRTLVLADRGQFDDSLIGSATIPQMLTYRAEQEWSRYWHRRSYLHAYGGSVDNTHDSFDAFRSRLADSLAHSPEVAPTAQVLGEFYSGNFDSAFARIQSKELEGTPIRAEYEAFVEHTKSMFPSRLNFAFAIGSWQPQGDNRLLGNHPEIGLYVGWENHPWRIDGVMDYRFMEADNDYTVDSLGVPVATDEFNSWLFGIDIGFKLYDTKVMSTDLFAGIGYDYILSIKEDGDPPSRKALGSPAMSVGLRHRFFTGQRSGTYLGAMVRYSMVEYGNRGGTDLSGNTLTLSMTFGWSIHETLKQFLDKLHYKGSSRP